MSEPSFWKKLFGSTRFWVALLAIIFVVLGTLVPAVMEKLDTVAITGATIALVSFIVAESVSPGGAPGWKIFGHFKFWSLVVSLAFIFIRAFVPSFLISEDLIQELIFAMGATSVAVSYRPIGTTRTR